MTYFHINLDPRGKKKKVLPPILIPVILMEVLFLFFFWLLVLFVCLCPFYSSYSKQGLDFREELGTFLRQGEGLLSGSGLCRPVQSQFPSSSCLYGVFFSLQFVCLFVCFVVLFSVQCPLPTSLFQMLLEQHTSVKVCEFVCRGNTHTPFNIVSANLPTCLPSVPLWSCDMTYAHLFLFHTVLTPPPLIFCIMSWMHGRTRLRFTAH